MVRTLVLGCLALAAACAASPGELEFEQAWEAAQQPGEDVVASDASGASSASSDGLGAIGAQWLWASGKAMPGVLLGAAYRMLRLDVETSLIALTEPAREFSTQFLGSQFGFHLMVRPLYGERWELAGGIGADSYSLWNVHGDLFEVALSVRGAAHFWLAQRMGVFVTARAYPLATSGLELGAARDESRGLPVLLGTGVEWRFQ